MKYNLDQVQFSPPDGIESKFFIVDYSQTENKTILVISFFGDYPNGSLGNKHGRFISNISLLGLHSFFADCVILDFRELTYRWGNSLLHVFQDISQFMDDESDTTALKFPIITLVSEKSKSGLLGLLNHSRNAQPESIFENLEQAIDYGIEKAKEWLNL